MCAATCHEVMVDGTYPARLGRRPPRQVLAGGACHTALGPGTSAPSSGPRIGGNIYYLAKFAGIFGLDVQDIGARQTGRHGGREGISGVSVTATHRKHSPGTGWLASRDQPRTPGYQLPAGAVDAHCHVFGPGSVFPYARGRKCTPADAPKEKLFALRDFLGFERNVIVQATCHGTDNRALVDALRSAGGRARGVASIQPRISRSELAEMHAAGVRAVRFNFVRRLADPKPDEYYWRLADKIAEFGWHVVVSFEPADLVARWGLITSLPMIVVVDHLSRPDVTQPLAAPGFTIFQRLMHDHGNVWAKLSGAERVSAAGSPDYRDFVPFARHIAQLHPDRVIWGTDWPHPNMRSHLPDEGDLVDLIPKIAPTEELQRRLLIGNPSRLYWKD
jgi:2-pyrone-4,6-dicarboxylate lactonase